MDREEMERQVTRLERLLDALKKRALERLTERQQGLTSALSLAWAGGRLSGAEKPVPHPIYDHTFYYPRPSRAERIGRAVCHHPWYAQSPLFAVCTGCGITDFERFQEEGRLS